MVKHRFPAVILGAGFTGLAAGCKSGFPVYEASPGPGGIGASYYIKPGESHRITKRPTDAGAYQFEIGGGHWLFGDRPDLISKLSEWTPFGEYKRHSAVYFPEDENRIPYPIQNHLRFFDEKTREQILSEINESTVPSQTMHEWLTSHFGETLGKIFFDPFHRLYTAGLYDRIAPQDAYKSPINLESVRRGALSDAPQAGYNQTFVYPKDGLGSLAKAIAEETDIYYGKRVVMIDPEKKRVQFADGSDCYYDRLASTLPLNRLWEMCGLGSFDHPYTSVLVLNIGAERGKKCPDEHWLYVPESRSGFHRVGFYSNVDKAFLPSKYRQANDHVTIYVERAFLGGMRPTEIEIEEYTRCVVEELRSWGFIEKVDVADPTWVEVAYTWHHPNKRDVNDYLDELSGYDIDSIGRYGRWYFQGILESLDEGFVWADNYGVKARAC